MKVFLLLSALLVCSSAARMFGVDNVRPIYELKEWQDKHPAFAKYLPKESSSQIEGRIVGGQEATPHQFPFQVALLSQFEEGVGLCGGSIVASDFILTAAHCVEPNMNVTIIIGAHNRLVEEPNQFRVWTTDVIIHPEWTPALIRNDIALLRLTTPLQWSVAVQPLLLPRVSHLGNAFANEQATVSGWGRFSDDLPQASPTLNWITVPTIANSVCNIWFLGTIQATNICAEQSTCQGDSGGPLTVVDEFGDTIQVGVVSFGIALGCERGWPTAFARVTSFHDWIHSVTGSSLLPRA